MTERFKHTRNAIGMQFISYDEKEILIGTFADAKGVTNIVELLNTLNDENEQLKEQITDWETIFNNCKHYKEAYGTEIVKIKQTIKDMMENERTEIGKMTLRHLWRQIQ